MSVRAALLALACGGLASCIGFSWQRTVVHRPIAPESLADLPRSGVPLAECLERLGAPTYVQEHRVHGLVLAWSWVHDRNLGASVSVPLSRWQNASFSYTNIRSKERGYVLWFDEELVLEDWREGFLRQLLHRPPPASPDDLEAS